MHCVSMSVTESQQTTGSWNEVFYFLFERRDNFIGFGSRISLAGLGPKTRTQIVPY